jgi:gliding motility-associated-like protein
MKIKHIILFLAMSMLTNIIIAQIEICNNGIDDDGDGLIDLNDTEDCFCLGGSTVEIPSLIPNPSFEDFDCCPNDLSQLDCAETWIQAGYATSDYFNTCGFTAGAPQPFPHGNGVTGMYFVDGWCEYVGACLLSPMISGEDYLMRFNMSFIFADGGTIESVSGNPAILSPVEVTLYGSASCGFLPFGGTGCPVGVGDWHELGTVSVTPSSIYETWAVFEIAFNPDVNINSIAIGAPCNLPGSTYNWSASGGPYFFVDNLLLNSTTHFESLLSTSGSFCNNNIILSLDTDSTGTYQWYHEGIALVGETNETLNISENDYPTGEYSLMFTHSGGCNTFNTTVNEVNITIDDIEDVVVCNSYNLPTITGTNLGSNTNFYTQPNGEGEIIISPITNSQQVYIYSSTGICSDQESFEITIIQEADFVDIPDQSTCGYYILPEIEGENLTGNEGFYNGTGGTGGIVTSPITESQTVYIYDNSICSHEEEFTVTITPEPEIDPIDNDTVCNYYNLPIISGSYLSGTQNYYSEPNGQGEILSSPLTTSQTVYIYDQINSCIDQQSFQLTVLSELSVYAGEDLFTCNDTVQLAAIFSYPFTTGLWTGTGNISEPYNPNTLVSSNYGTHQFVWRESFYECYGLDTVTVHFLEKPSPFIIEEIDSVCTNTYNLSVLNSNFDGYWTAYTGDPLQVLTPAPNYLPSIISPNATVTIGNFSSNLSDVTFIWTETNQISGISCEAQVQKRVSFIKQPVASVGATNEAEICGNCYTELNASTVGSSYAQGLWISPHANCNFINQDLPQAEICLNEPGIFGDSAHIRMPVLWTMSNYFCTDIDTMWLTFYQQPVANAGLDDAVCGLNTELQAFYDLHEHNDLYPTGIWSVGIGQLGEFADFSDIYQANSLLSVSAPGIWGFIFRESNYLLNSCYDTDTVIIEFVETPVISAGPDMEICGNNATLNAVSGGFTGTWLPVPGIVYENYSDPQTNITGISGTTYTLSWLESNQATTSTLSCSAIDEMILTLWKMPTANILTDAADSFTCGRRFNNLRAENPGSDIRGYWYDTNPGTIYGQYDSIRTWVEVYDHGCFDFFWIEETGPIHLPGFCADTAGPLNICFIEIPDANAGNDTIFCGLTGSLNAVPTVGTGVWSNPTFANISFSNNHDPMTTISTLIYNSNSENPESYTLVWTEDNGGGCTDSDIVEVFFAEIPQSQTTIIPPKCFGESATIASIDTIHPQYTWNFYNGIVNSSNLNQLNASYASLVNWANSDSIHLISLIVTNEWGCLSPINIDTVVEPNIPDLNSIIISDTCALSKGGINLENNEDISYFWINENIGPEYNSPISSVSNLPSGEYLLLQSYLTTNIENYAYYLQTFGTANCIDTISFEIPTIGMLVADFDISADIIMEELVAPEATLIFVNNSEYDDVSKRCEWHFDDGNILKSCDELIEHVYTESGCFNPFLIVMNRDLPECRDTAFLEYCINVENMSNLEIPNIFSPNGDGFNDYFQVKAVSLKDFNGKITNRWGRTLFEWSDWETYTAGWDGKISTGNEASPGVYYYLIKATGIDGYEYERNGAFHLMRE